MKNLILAVAFLLAMKAQAQVSILDILPTYVEQEVEVIQLPNADGGYYGDTSVYTFEIEVIQKIENLVFEEHRVNRFVNALVYRVEETPFKVRLITPDEDDEIQNSFIHIYRN